MKITTAALIVIMIATASHAGVMIEEMVELPNHFEQPAATSKPSVQNLESDINGFIQFLIMSFLVLL